MYFPVSALLIEYLILTIVETQDSYGYEISQTIKLVADIKESTLYPILKRLEKGGFVTTYSQEYQGRKRKYYSITEQGRQQIAYLNKEWIAYRDTIDGIIEGEDSKLSKEEYLNKLRKYLKKLPQDDYEDAMEYFTEYFEETDEEGAQALMAELGSPKVAAHDLMSQLLDKKLTEKKIYSEQMQEQKKKSGSHIFWIACLAILAAPIGAPLLFALAIVLFCVVLCVALVLLCVFILAFALFLAGGKLFLRGILAVPLSVPGFAIISGTGLLSIGIGILTVVLGVYLCKWFGLLFVKLAQKISSRKKVK